MSHLRLLKVVVGLGNGFARTVSIDNSSTLTVFKGHTSQVNKVLRVNDQQLITSSTDTTVKLWTLNNGTYLCGYYNHSKSVRSAIATPYNMILTGGCDGQIKYWDLSGALLNSFTAHTGCVNDLEFHRTLNVYLSAGDDKTVKVSAFSTPMGTMGPVAQAINCLVVLRDGRIVAGSNRIDMWLQTYANDLTGGLNPMSSTSTVAILSMTVLPDGLTVACGLANGRIRFFDAASKAFLANKDLNGHNNKPVNGLDILYMSDTRQVYLVSGSDDMAVNIWEYSTSYLAKRINMDYPVKSVYHLYNQATTSKLN